MGVYSSLLYKRLPISAQNAITSVRSLTRNVIIKHAGYQRYLSMAMATQWLSRQELRQLQNDRLYLMLEHCLRHIDFYKKFLPTSLKPYRDDIFPLLDSLPRVNKKQVVENSSAFSKTGGWPAVFKGSTSGTSGSPLKIYQDYNTIIRESAFVERQLQWVGYKFGEPQACIRGDMIVPASNHSGPYWRIDSYLNSLMLSAYHISPETCDAYIAAIESFKPVLIRAYPSAIGALAHFLENHSRDIRCDSIRAIVVSSETLLPEVKEIIEKRFGAKVYNWYGSFERVAAMGTCEYGNIHVLSDYSYVEFFHKRENIYTICGSTIQNFKMPLIRYNLNDEFLEFEENYSCPCGRSFPTVQHILGREDDYVFTPNGYAIGRLGHIFKGVHGILGAQIIQETLGEIKILIVPASLSISESCIDTIKKNACLRLGDNIKIKVQAVSELRKTPNGKIKFVISYIKR